MSYHQVFRHFKKLGVNLKQLKESGLSPLFPPYLQSLPFPPVATTPTCTDVAPVKFL